MNLLKYILSLLTKKKKHVFSFISWRIFSPGIQSLFYNTIYKAQLVKNLPVVQETWVQFLGQEDPLEMEIATHSSILAWKIPRTEEPGGLQSIGSQRVGQD